MGIETLALAAIATTVVGAGVSAYGAYSQGQAQAEAAQMQGVAAAQQAQYQAAIADINRQTAERNAGLAETNAQFTETAGARLQEDRARRIRSIIGAQRAGLAANGLLIDAGTGVDLQEDVAELGGLAIAEIRSNAGRQASGYRIQGANAMDEALAATLRGQAYQIAGANALAAGNFAADAYSTAGTIAAGSSLLGGATSTFDRFGRMQASGVRMSSIPAVT
jgi:hypothetical protein